MEVSEASFSSPCLLCRESLNCSDEELEETVSIYLNSNYSISETEDEYVEMLVKKEVASASERDGSSSDHKFSVKIDSWLKCARLDAVEWIMKTKAFFGFRYQTAYLAVTYFDRFLSSRTVENGKSWAIELLSIACLSIAAKMEECRVPALSEFVSSKYSFESKLIQEMEILVLSTLEWRMDSITPFAYLHYFIAKFSDESRPKDLASRAVGFILAMTKEINLMDRHSYAIAAAAILASLDRRLTRNKVGNKMSSLSPPVSFEIDHVFSCYNIMQDIEVEELKASPMYSSPKDALDDSPIKPEYKTKRKRLTFSDSSQERGTLL